DAAMPRLCPLAEFELDHLHLGAARLLRKPVGIKGAVFVPAAEIAAAQLPYQVATVLQVIPADGTFTGIVGEIAQPRALVQSQDGIGAQRAEAHRRDVEDRGRIRLPAGAPADLDAKRLGTHRDYRQQ